MEKLITGKTHIFGNNIDTDQIYPGRFVELVNPKDIAKYAMIGAKADFLNDFTIGDVIIGGTNFGCGSSREHAVITLKSAGVGAVVAKSFGRIFYRNAINLGLPLIVCKEMDKLGLDGGAITIDTEKWIITNHSNGIQIPCEAISEYALEIMEYGGIKNMIKVQYKN